MSKRELPLFEEIKSKAEEIAACLRENFEPHMVVIITENDVRVMRAEYGCLLITPF